MMERLKQALSDYFEWRLRDRLSIQTRVQIAPYTDADIHQEGQRFGEHGARIVEKAVDIAINRAERKHLGLPPLNEIDE